jgi:hypothetical protein
MTLNVVSSPSIGALQKVYSITSSAVASTVGETVRSSALAVLRLMTNSNFVGCSTGRSAGFVGGRAPDQAANAAAFVIEGLMVPLLSTDTTASADIGGAK